MIDFTKIKVEKYPYCDFCDSEDNWTSIAKYDGKTVYGPWANMCEKHFKEHGVGIGMGKGQKLIVEEI